MGISSRQVKRYLGKKASCPTWPVLTGFADFGSKLKIRGLAGRCFSRSAMANTAAVPASVGRIKGCLVRSSVSISSLGRFVAAPNGSINSDWLVLR